MMKRVPFQRIVALALSVLAAAVPASGEDSRTASTTELLQALQAEYGSKEKKYEALAKKVAKEVDKALSKASWDENGQAGTLDQHPYLEWVADLAQQARAGNGKKPDSRTRALLERFPWGTRLEFDLGLDHGSDRPVPDHELGFIHLGTAPDPMPGFPELSVNHYLYGLQEIVGWQFAVETKKDLRFRGRETKGAAEMTERLPAWEELRVGLEGYPPDVALVAIPALTHAIHSRLAERRTMDAGDKGDAGSMEPMLAFLDSKWNGFTFQTPYAQEPLPVVVDPHRLYTDDRGFIHRFEIAGQLASVGDIPFVASATHVQYAAEFMDMQVTVGDFVRESADSKKVLTRFLSESTYLARYKKFIELIVRAVLVPDRPFPQYLLAYDFRGGEFPTERGSDAKFDVPRRHAILAWAYAGKDPVALADFLYDHMLSKEENAFPADVSLPIQLTWLVRDKEGEMLEGIATRCKEGRGDDDLPASFEREFSPHATYLDPSTELGSDSVLTSFLRFHAPLAQGIAETVHATVSKVVD